MKRFYQFIGLFLFLNIMACGNTQEKPAVDHVYNPDKLYTIDADNTKELIDLKLSNLVDSLVLVPLETSKQCLLDGGTEYFVSDKYILAYSKDGVYKFSPTGKFISEFVRVGRGPGEIHWGAGFSTFVVDEKKDLLYIYDQSKKHKFLVYDINAENFVGPVKKALPGSGIFAIYEDSLLISSQFSYNDSIGYAAYVQNMEGELVSGIDHNKQMLNSKNKKVYQPSILHFTDTCYRSSFAYNDTLFTIKGNGLIPYLALDFDLPRENPPNKEKEKGGRTIFFPFVEALDFMIITVFITQEVIRYSSGVGKEKWSKLYLFFDKTTGKGSRIGTYADDLIGETHDVEKQSKLTGTAPIKFPEILPNGKFVVAYQPYQIMEALKNGLDHDDFSTEIKEQLLNINKNSNENDNPVLLIGVPKKKT